MNVMRMRVILLLFVLSLFVILSCVWVALIKRNIYDDLNMKSEVLEIENLHLQRRLHIANMCRNFDLNDTIKTLPNSLLDHIIVDDTHKLLYCFVPKVACTNWKRVLLVLRGVKRNPLSISGNETHIPNLFITLNQYSLKEVEEKLRTYIKFMFVRHPYERLLSAYRNKFENSYSNYFRLHFGTEIIKGYRNNPSQESLSNGHDVTFNEFLEYIVNLNQKNHKILFNEHWRPAFDLCHPCHIQYNVIGKYDTLDSDARYVLWKAGLDDLVSFPNREQSYKFQPTIGVMLDYYRNISDVLRKKLSDVYKDDFSYFEYESQMY